jgi:hypothetical protein
MLLQGVLSVEGFRVLGSQGWVEALNPRSQRLNPSQASAEAAHARPSRHRTCFFGGFFVERASNEQRASGYRSSGLSPSVKSASVQPLRAPSAATASTSSSVMYARRPRAGGCANVQ